MLLFRLWNNLSIRKKIWGLVLLPILVILGLTSRQMFIVNDQLDSLKKATHIINIIDVLKKLNNASYESRLIPNSTNMNKAIAEVKIKTSTLFSNKEISNFQQLIAEYQETLDAISTAEDFESKNDSIQWQVDVQKQFLLTLEKVKFDASTSTITNHLNALFQIEWLMLWAQEENWQSHLIVNDNGKDIRETLRNKIVSLVQSQQLFIDRFLAMNADATQASLMLNSFSNVAFETSNTYRQQLLDPELINNLTPRNIALGNQALSQRLLLFKDVADAISEQLKQEITSNINEVEQQRLLFICITTISILLVLIFGITLARRITNNLNEVLDYLENNKPENYSLSEHILGRDEFSRFATKIETLNEERQKNQQELLTSKNEAVKSKEQAIQASKAKSSFLANMSHEIRTPLNGVIGVSEILSSTQLNVTQKDYVDTIETSSQLLLSLINDILDFSKIESGKLHIHSYPTSLRECIYDIASIVAPKLKEKGVSLNIDIDNNLPRTVMADDHRIRQVLMNLMSNAAKFTESGSVTIGIKCALNDQSYVFEVIDTGIGITDIQQKQIFEPFSQADESTTRKFGGTGLGLAISTQLVELMGGQLHIDSSIDKGSRFYFVLPLEAGKDLVEKPLKIADDTNVIIVCEDKKVTNILIRELEYYDVKIHLVTNQLSDVNFIDQTHSQIVICVTNNHSLQECAIASLSSLNHHSTAICILQPFDAQSTDFGPNVSAIVTFPLLGKQLKKSLERCNNFIQEGTKNTTLSIDNKNAQQIEGEQTEQTSNTKDIALNATPTSSQTPLRVLLVEDNRINQKVAILIFNKAGYTYVVANDGQEAINIYSEDQHFDVILMDLMMPIKDGFEASKEIRAFEKTNNLPEVPIIAVTASVMNDDIKQCFYAGMNSYIPKPIKPEKLYDEIKTLTSKETSAEEKARTAQQNFT